MTLRLLTTCSLAFAVSQGYAQDKYVATLSNHQAGPLEQAEVDATVRQSLRQHVHTMMAELTPAARAGYDHLVGSAYLPPDFNEAILTELEQNEWQLPFKHEFQTDSPWSKTRADMLAAFGISPRPDNPSKPLQYVTNAKGDWVMNCFACHGGSTYGVLFPGSPNTTFQLEALTEQIRRTKLRLKEPLSHMDLGSIFMPLGTSVGTSNAVMFGVALMSFRDKDLNVLRDRGPAPMVHHDMDTPPWWMFQRKSHMYIDGFAEKGSRGLMQFMLIHKNGPEKFRAWADDFEDVYAFISQVQSPKYPLPIDVAKADRGQLVFDQNCASCHGTYEAGRQTYPELDVDLTELGTDPVRHRGLSPPRRHHYGQSWFADYGGQDTIYSPIGYTAPPLDGVWASAPYLHNGSVPTLWDLLHPESRPKIWRRTSESFDASHVGFQFERLPILPEDYTSLTNYQRHWIFDSSVPGKSNAGHDFPAALSESQRDELLEYLKRL